MKTVIYIEQPETNEKPVEFTHEQAEGKRGWVSTSVPSSNYQKIAYLGKCKWDGDMFAAYDSVNRIVIFKGHLNSGKY